MADTVRRRAARRAPDSTVDAGEVARFEKLARDWWDPDGPMKPLHRMNPVRLAFIRDIACRHFGRDPKSIRSFEGLAALDVGCGAGLVAEPRARRGAHVTGLDPAPGNVAAARKHAEASGLVIDYSEASVDGLAVNARSFDLVLALEVVEHVADPEKFVAACGHVTKPGGLLVMSTLNRTLKAFGLAIVAVEYVLGWLPRGTHDWEKFLRPRELERLIEDAGLKPAKRQGIVYNPLIGEWRLSPDTDVNYLVAAVKSA